ncbi:MAG: hypothetical protein WB817_01815 [Terriglobales bacterium]
MALNTVDFTLLTAGLICLGFAAVAQRRMILMINRRRPSHQQWPLYWWEPKPADWRVWGNVFHVHDQYEEIYGDRGLPFRCKLAFILCLTVWTVDFVLFSA